MIEFENENTEDSRFNMHNDSLERIGSMNNKNMDPIVSNESKYSFKYN